MTRPEHPLSRVWLRLARGEAVVAGTLSGTSGDGIDVALMRLGVRGVRRPLAAVTVPFPASVAGRVRGVLDGLPVGPRELALLDRDLGLAFGDAVRGLAEEGGLEVDLVGSHGQTVWHHDGIESEGRGTLQLGNGALVAARTGAVTVNDFRQADLALGGEGAPISAACDGELFADVPRPAVILNLGGIANATWLPASGDPIGFDTGPAGALLDGLARALLQRPMDRGGAVALRGRVHEGLLAELLAHPFFARQGPRSTGRDTFGATWVGEVLGRVGALGLAPPDALATAVACVARSVVVGLRQGVGADLAGCRRLVLCGGGAHNLALIEALERDSGLTVASSADHGVDPKVREAIVFGLLAVRCVQGLPSTIPTVTGARPGGILGAIHLPPFPAGGGASAESSGPTVAGPGPADRL
jgi:anhydro-N-acetylmuramic acid kinase